MDNHGNAREKVTEAFKGFIINHKRERFSAPRFTKDVEYRSAHSWYLLSDQDELEFRYREKDHQRLLDLVDSLHSGQTHRQFVSRCLMQAAREWVEGDHSIEDISELEQSAEGFLEKVEKPLARRWLYLPVEGLNVRTAQSLQLGRCQLLRNSSDSELMQLVQRYKERRPSGSEDFLSPIEEAPAFFKVDLIGHPRQAIEKAIEEAQLALNVLRLFLGSFYENIYLRPSTPRQMRLVGAMPGGAHSNVLHILRGPPLGKQFPGGFVRFKGSDCFDLNQTAIDSMKDCGLSRINLHLQSLDTSNGVEVAGGLMRAINWFGKATMAGSVCESFLMCAIAVEGLLSGGDRVPKETYAKRMAALVTRGNGPGIYPMDGYVCQEFAQDLEAARERSDRLKIIESRVIELFKERNRIAHGGRSEDETHARKQLDLETLVRNSILSFVDGGWGKLQDFKEWMNTRVNCHS